MAKGAKEIGFIGVGVMGGPMARRLVERGHAVVVHDTNPAAVKALVRHGAKAAAGTREVADRASIVFTSLPNPGVSREVVLGAEGVVHGTAVKICVDLSTTGTKVEKEMAAGLARRGITLVDCPVSGGAAGAAAGTLAVIVSGERRAVAQLRPMLDVFGKVFVAGDRPGQAQMLKLLNNLLSTTALAVSCEAMVAGVKAGLDPDVMIAAINTGSGRNSATQDKIPRAVLTRSFDFGFPISGALKDVGLAIDECESLGVPMRVGSAVRQLWQYAYSQGEPQRDMTALVTYLEKLAGGVVVKGKGARAGKRRK